MKMDQNKENKKEIIKRDLETNLTGSSRLILSQKKVRIDYNNLNEDKSKILDKRTLYSSLESKHSLTTEENQFLILLRYLESEYLKTITKNNFKAQIEIAEEQLNQGLKKVIGIQGEAKELKQKYLLSKEESKNHATFEQMSHFFEFTKQYFPKYIESYQNLANTLKHVADKMVVNEVIINQEQLQKDLFSFDDELKSTNQYCTDKQNEIFEYSKDTVLLADIIKKEKQIILYCTKLIDHFIQSQLDQTIKDNQIKLNAIMKDTEEFLDLTN